MTKKFAAIAAVWLMGSTLAFAQGVIPSPSSGDPRIRVVSYSENQIVSLRGYLGYQMLIEFGPDEQIENVAIGDSLGWQVTPNRAATLLFVKPITRGAATNMTVITSMRRYSFQLVAREATGPSDPNIIYTVRFAYPPVASAAARVATAPTPAAPALADLNLAYSVKNAGRALGVRVFDDGRATFFQFAEADDAPAIFLLGPNGKEELVNAQWRGQYMVVDQIAQDFVLRIGRRGVHVHNDGWKAPTPPPLAVGRR